MRFSTLPRKRRPAVLALAVALTVPAALATSGPATAAVSCRVGYTVASQWSGGFVADVTINNLGDAVNGWTLTWAFTGGQQVASGWNAAVTQSGSTVTAKNVGYNGSLGSGGTATFGFQGSSSGTTNPVPTGFTLNGVACTGGGTPTTPATSAPVTTAPVTSAPVTTPARTTAPATTTPPATTRPPTTTPGSWANCSSDQWARFTDGAYTIYNNIWGSGAGSQQLCANSHSNWRVVANHPNTGGIKSYPNASLTLNKRLSAVKSLTSSFNVTVPSSGAYETTYDLWANNNAYEVMVWMNQAGAVGPIAESYDANGAVPAVRNVSLGGHTWNIYRGSNGANAVFSFVRTSNTTSGTVDLLALMTWLRTNKWWDDVLLGDQQFGYEITSASGGLTFTTNSYSLNAG